MPRLMLSRVLDSSLVCRLSQRRQPNGSNGDCWRDVVLPLESCMGKRGGGVRCKERSTAAIIGQQLAGGA